MQDKTNNIDAGDNHLDDRGGLLLSFIDENGSYLLQSVLLIMKFLVLNLLFNRGKVCG